MVAINKNSLTKLDSSLALNNSQKNTEELFAELFALINDKSVEKNEEDEVKKVFLTPNDNESQMEINNETLNVSKVEIETAKYLAETFYKEIGILNDSKNIAQVNESKPNQIKLLSEHKNEIPIKFQAIKLKKNQSSEKKLENQDFKHENKFEFTVKIKKVSKSFQEIESNKNNKSFIFDNQKDDVRFDQLKKIENTKPVKSHLKSEISNLVEKKNKKKLKQITIKNFNEIEVQKTSSTKEGIKHFLQTKSHKSLDKQTLSLDVRKNSIDKVNANLKTSRENLNHNSKILDFMESNWEQKLSVIIKESIKNNSNIIELDVKPKNLGKIRLEIKVENEITKIDFSAENTETTNLLNENLSKISDHLKNDRVDGFLSQNKGNSGNFNDNKRNNKKSENTNSLKNNKEKLVLNKNANSKHNIDVNA